MKKPRHTVTDHAVLRYLERVRGMDIEAVRRGIGADVDRAAEGHDGMCSVLIGGMRYIIAAPGVVVTVQSQNRPERGKGPPRGDRGGT